MSAGGDLPRPALPPATTARALAAAPEGWHAVPGGDDVQVTSTVSGRPPATAAWLGGAPFDAGVRFSVSGLGYERLNR